MTQTDPKPSKHALKGEIIKISKGLAIYQTHASPYWFARIRDPISKRNVVRSTKETSRLEARKVAEVRIPTKPAMHSNRKPATYSNMKPAGIPI